MSRENLLKHLAHRVTDAPRHDRRSVSVGVSCYVQAKL